MTNTAETASATVEDRLRIALAELTRMRGSRCSEGTHDAPAAAWTTALAPPTYALA